MYGQETWTHLRELVLGLQDDEGNENAHPEDHDGAFPSMPSSLNTALSEMDLFSPTEDLSDVEHRDCAVSRAAAGTSITTAESLHIAIAHSLATANDEHSMLSRDEIMFDMDDQNEGSEEELTDDDDVDDDDMEEIHDIEGIVDNLIHTHQRRVTDEDVLLHDELRTEYATSVVRESARSLQGETY